MKIVIVVSLAVSFAIAMYLVLSLCKKIRDEEKEFRYKVEWFSILSEEERKQYEWLCDSYQKFVSKKDGGQRSDDGANGTDKNEDSVKTLFP